MRYSGLRTNGWNDDSKPTSTDAGLPATWGTNHAPSSRLAVIARSIQSRHQCGAKSTASTWNVTGMSALSEIWRIQSNSDAGSAMSLATENTRWPVPPSAEPIATSSSNAAVVPAASSPSLARCRIVRVVDTPIAPASAASRARRAISAISPGVASSFGRPEPSTYARSAPWGSNAATSSTRGIDSSSSRYSGNDSQFHDMPSSSAAPGMSSTPSISWMRKSRSSGRAGAKPTPQLPITTVVTPCHPDGETSGSQVA